MKFKKGNKAAKGGRCNPPGGRPSKEQQEINKADRQIAKTYQPTPDERGAVEAVRVRGKKTPRVKVSSEGNAHKILLDHPKRYYGCFLSEPLTQISMRGSCRSLPRLQHGARASTKYRSTL
jgi:hypothetical protein